MAESGARVMARVTKGDGETLAALFDEDVIGRPVTIARVDGQHRFTLAV